MIEATGEQQRVYSTTEYDRCYSTESPCGKCPEVRGVLRLLAEF